MPQYCNRVLLVTGLLMATFLWWTSTTGSNKAIEPQFSTASYLYVGNPNKGIPPMNKTYVIDQNFRLWVGGGMVSTDFAIANVSEWNITGTNKATSSGAISSRMLLTTPHGSNETVVSMRLLLSTLLERVQALEDQVRMQETRIAEVTAGCLGTAKD